MKIYSWIFIFTILIFNIVFGDEEKEKINIIDLDKVQTVFSGTLEEQKAKRSALVEELSVIAFALIIKRDNMELKSRIKIHDSLYLELIYPMYGATITFIERRMKNGENKELCIEVLKHRLKSLIGLYPITIEDDFKRDEEISMTVMLAYSYKIAPKVVVKLVKKYINRIPIKRQSPFLTVLYFSGDKEVPKNITEEMKKLFSTFRAASHATIRRKLKHSSSSASPTQQH